LDAGTYLEPEKEKVLEAREHRGNITNVGPQIAPIFPPSSTEGRRL
jgi:hypothetical protein